MDRFSYINIREYLKHTNPDKIGEADLQIAISDFSCPQNLDVERFLKKNSIEFTKKINLLHILFYQMKMVKLLGISLLH